MKKLLALAVLSTVSFAAPCFGVDFIRDRVYSSFSSDSVAIGYHYTDNVKISVAPTLFFSNIIDVGKLHYLSNNLQPGQLSREQQQQLAQKSSDSLSKSMTGILVNLHYHYEFTNTDITPYIGAGIGASRAFNGKYSLLYKISSGVNLPLSSRTDVFAGYSLLKEFGGHDHGLEFGMRFNL